MRKWSGYDITGRCCTDGFMWRQLKIDTEAAWNLIYIMHGPHPSWLPQTAVLPTTLWSRTMTIGRENPPPPHRSCGGGWQRFLMYNDIINKRTKWYLTSTQTKWFVICFPVWFKRLLSGGLAELCIFIGMIRVTTTWYLIGNQPAFSKGWYSSKNEIIIRNSTVLPFYVIASCRTCN